MYGLTYHYEYRRIINYEHSGNLSLNLLLNDTQEGVGLSFLYYVPTTSVVDVPVVSADVLFVFEEVTND